MKRLISTIILIQLTFLNADNYSLSFDGVDDYVDLGRPANLNFIPQVNSFSIFGWVKASTFGTIYSFGASANTSDTQIKLVIRSDNNCLEINIGGTISYGITSLNDGNWHHVAITVPDSTSGLKMYIDGILETFGGGNGDIGNMQSNENGNIGARTNGTGYFYDGLIDNLSIWDTELSQEQIQPYLSSSLSGSETGLVGYWDFNEGTGTTLTDQTVSGNDGVIYGATWDEDGSLVDPPPPPPNADNYSLSFDGDDDYAVILDASSHITNSNASLLGWFKINEFDAINPLIGFRNYPSDDCSMYAVMGTNGTIETMVYENLQSFIEGHNSNQWYHIALVYNGDTFKTYLDGDFAASIDAPSSIFNCSDTDLLFGGMQIGNFENLNGLIDDVSLWSIDLTEEQINTHMNTQLSGDEDGLEGYWDFNDGEGTTLTDLSGNENHGTINGATWDEDGAPVEPNSIAALTVQEVDGGLGTTVSIPIDIDLMGIDISSTEIRFSGFQDHVNFIEVDTTGTLVGAAGWSIEVNEQEDLLITGSYGSTEISANGTLFKLKFEIPEEVGVEFVPINITHAEMDELEGAIGITDGGISIQELLWGDVSQNDDVSLYDASLVLKYLVGTETLDETQLIVADVTQDATISALDATAIAQYVVEIIDELPVDNTQNLSGGGEFVINEDMFSPGNLLEIPVLLTGGNNLLSFEFDISYDSDIVTFENVEWSEMINHFTIEENTEDGSIRFAGMGTTPDGEEGVFTTVSLFVASNFNGESLDVTVNRSRINESEPIEDLVITFTNTVLSVDTKAIPKVYALRQNYPNPFNPTTQIKYDLPEDALVTINIYDLTGRSIKSLVNSNQSAGYRSIQWNATNNLGEPVSAGMYIYMIQAGEFRQTKKMVLLK